MPGSKRPRRERTDTWQDIKQWILWPEQELYEQIRPLVLFGQTAGERAKEIDIPQRTLARRADAFERSGMASLFSSGEQGGARDSSKSLPPAICQLIVDLHAELPTMSWREIAEVCYIRYARRPDHKSVKHIATATPPRKREARRYQPWHLIPDPAERKLAIVRLHSEGWSITSIAQYLQASRPTIYATLQRWTEEGVAGLEEKSKARKGPRKVTLTVTNEVRKLQENPLLGKFRVHTALLRMGIEVSPATCARIMAANRQLYGLDSPRRQPRTRLEMPFKAVRRHEYRSCDVRYIEDHLLPDPKPVYVITVFENFSRMVLSSAISLTQNQWDYLAVLVDAIRRYGAPEALVTDGGGIFSSTMATALYEMLGIRKERIEAGQPWQNYAETLFSIQRRLADYSFSQARTWPQMQQAHRTWWTNYNHEHHFAHRTRQDGRHSPEEVLRGVLGRTYPDEVLSRILYATQFPRRLDAHGYAHVNNWRFFGEDGLAGEQVAVWMYEGTLKIVYQATALSEYTLHLSPDHRRIEAVKQSRRIETHFRSPQLQLWQTSETEWLLALRQPERHQRKSRPGPAEIVQLRFPEVSEIDAAR
ncbi:MAG TPA: helix-turn-helix domain-containing protein [Ktedonobacteraceae bacterium]|nr:helix-turn-helix domain-containing protein [Ktedonobacteraceae bacterium]